MKRIHLAAIPFVLLSMPVIAARPVDLSHQSPTYLNALVGPTVLTTSNLQQGSAIKEISRSTDFKNTTHIRVNQTYAGYPVWNGEAIVHVANQPKNNALRTLLSANNKKSTRLNGTIYEDLQNDLQSTPTIIFQPEQAKKALAEGLAKAQVQDAEFKKTELFVYIDENNKAHWVFHVSFQITRDDNISQPNFLMDAVTFAVYQQWDNVKTALEDVRGGGIGGNPKLGKLTYDGAKGDLAELNIQRNPETATCYLQNDMLSVADFNTRKIGSFNCYRPDKNHNDVYWNKYTTDEVNEGFSPNNDSYFAGEMLQRMYKELFGIDVLTKNGKPMPLRILTHKKFENAEWIENLDVMVIGDGKEIFYPLSSIGVIAHEVSHGYTAQHSNLVYGGQSGGLNESFSDMAAQVVDLYAYGHNTWMIGEEIKKEKNSALRYMDKPSKDCYDGAERCSIDDTSGYYPGMNVHNSSGVYNRAFYLLATSPGWDVNKAFKVMIQANTNYWTRTATFDSAACGVISAAEDFDYSTDAIKKVFRQVGVDTSQC